jgi:hypothetical protein
MKEIKFLVKSEKGITFGGAYTIEGAKEIKKNQERDYKNYPKSWGPAPVFHIEEVK